MIYPNEPTGNFGKRLAVARRAHSLTVKQVADKTGLRPDRISGLEHGRAAPSLDDLRRIVRATGIDMACLLATRDGADDAHAARHLKRRTRNASADPDDLIAPPW